MARWETFAAFLEDALQAANDDERQALVNDLLNEQQQWPWVEDDRATFIYTGLGTDSVAVNLDTIASDPPFAQMDNLPGTSFWYVTRPFAPDDLLDYMLAVDDPMTPLAGDPNVVDRIARYWRVDPLNPQRINTAQLNVSVLRMKLARPFPDWSALPRVPRGRVEEHNIDSNELGFNGRKLWVYTPPGYEASGRVYPLLILQDGQWCVGPLQVPYIADALIKHNRLKPLVIAMVQSAGQQERMEEYVSNDRHYAFVLTELLPFVQTRYGIDSENIGIGGVAIGAIAAAHAALNNPVVFSKLIMISPPLGKGAMQEQLKAYRGRFEAADKLPRRIFQSIGRYEQRGRFYKPAQRLHEVLSDRRDTVHHFVEVGSGHGLVGFRSVFPEALAWVLPGIQ